VDLLLLELRLMGFLRLAVLELAIVHQLAYRRLGQGGDFYEVYFGFLGHLHSLRDRHNTDLLAPSSYQPHFGCVDLDVDALRSIRGDVYLSKKLKN
jgi:hypothetical protein